MGENDSISFADAADFVSPFVPMLEALLRQQQQAPVAAAIITLRIIHSAHNEFAKTEMELK